MFKGYIIERDIVSKTLISEAKTFLEAQIADQLKALHEIPDTIHPDTYSDSHRKLLTGHFPPEIRLDSKIISVVTCKRLTNYIKAITGWEALNIHLPPMARFILPNNSEAKVPAHQDLTYNKHLKEFITVWLPLVDIDTECGGVACSHDPSELIEDVGLSDNKVWFDTIESQDMEFHECVPMTMGDALIFSPTTIHKSMNNISNRIRLSLDLRYFPAHHRSPKHFLSIEDGVVHDPE